MEDKDLVSNHVERVEIQSDQIVIQLSGTQKTNRQSAKDNKTLHVPWHKTESTRRREILLSGPIPLKDSRPIRSETRATLVASIARGRHWLDKLTTDPTANVQAIAKREGCSARKVNMTISLAFLAPGLVNAAIGGRLPRGMGVARLCDMPAEWSRQLQMLGPHFCGSAIVEPVSACHSLRFRETGFRGQRIRRRNSFLNRIHPWQRLSARGKPRQLGAI